MTTQSNLKRASQAAAVPVLGLLLVLVLHFQPNGVSMAHSALDYVGALCLVATVALSLKLARRQTDLLENQKRELMAEVYSRTMELERRDTEQRKLALVAARTDNSVVITDGDGRIEWVNDGFTRQTGYTLVEVAGRTPGSVLQGADTDPGERARIRAAIRAAQPFESELVNYSKDGRRYWVHISAQPICDLAGRLTNFIAIESDVTLRREAAEALERAKEAAEAASNSKSEFLANISHELRTPLTAILGYGDLLLEDPRLPEDLREGARSIRASGEHLLGLINDILDISKIEAGHMTLERLECSPVALVREVEALMRGRAAARQLSLHVEFTPPIPRTIQTDPTRLRQVLINLVGNAIKFTHTGSVVLRVGLVGPPERPMLGVSVEDTGIGIEPQRLETLFTAFTQGDASTTRRFGGTGLGLAISRRLARALGGNIMATSTPGRGSTFRVTIDPGDLSGVPMVHDPAPIPLPIVAGEPAATPRPLTGVRVLLADDGADNQRLLRHLLMRAGAEVDVAETGVRAVVMALAAEAEPAPYRLVVMDMQMPEMDGYEATRALRAAGFKAPILALTAHAMAGDREKCLAAGCDDYLTKPIDRARLIEACGRWGAGRIGGEGRREAA